MLVLFIHTQCHYDVITVLKSFTMPVFFFLSGYLFSAERNPEFKPFAVKRFRQLIVPYLWMSALMFIPWALVLRFYGGEASHAYPWHYPLPGILLGLPNRMVHNVPLWSFLCFFSVEMVYFTASQRLKLSDGVIGGVALMVALGVNILADDTGFVLPFSLAALPVGLIFYTLGHWMRSGAPLLLRFHPLLLLVWVAMLAIGVAFNDRVVFYRGFLGQPGLFLLASIGGILTVVQLSAMLAQLIGSNPIVRLISTATLIICGFHLTFYALFKGVLLLLTPISPDLLFTSIPVSILVSLLTLLLCLPISRLIQRRCRFLVSK